MKRSDIENFFNDKNLDIRRKKNNPRFLDQKCTPDVLSFIADCICQLKLKGNKFVRNDIFKDSYFIKNASFIFGKPSPKNKKTINEYDKFISQPLDLFSYAGILEKKKYGNINEYTIKNKEMLEFISINEQRAFDFLHIYLDKFSEDSGLISYVNEFIKTQDIGTFENIKKKFIKLVLAYSDIGTRGSKNSGEVEIRRIFPKFLNIFSVYNNKKGVEKGRISKGCFIFVDLMYNRINFRDKKKLKNITRNESKMLKFSRPSRYIEFQTQKAIKWIKLNHPYSEVKGNGWGKTEAVHHIFPRKDFPEISYYLENLIALTAKQHFSLAHPNGHTNKIDPMYQKICLLAKKDTINEQINGKYTQYSLPNFVFVLTKGFKKNISVNAPISEIIKNIEEYYKIK